MIARRKSPPLLLVSLLMAAIAPSWAGAQNTGTVAGRVGILGNTNPLICATVTAEAEGWRSGETYTDARGFYRIDRVPTGRTVTVRAAFSRYTPSPRYRTLSPGDSLRVDIDLIRAPSGWLRRDPPRVGDPCRFGRVAQMKELLADGTAGRRKVEAPGPFATIDPEGPGGSHQMWTQTPLSSVYRGDRLNLRRRYHARVEVDHAGQRGTLAFFPAVRDSVLFEEIHGRTAAVGAWSLRPDPKRPGDIAVYIEAGHLEATWRGGNLSVYLAGQDSAVRVLGTSVMMGVSEDSTAYVYVREASGPRSLVFDGSAETVAMEDSLYRLEAGDPVPKSVNLAELGGTVAVVGAALAAEALFQSSQLWGRTLLENVGRSCLFWCPPILLDCFVTKVVCPTNGEDKVGITFQIPVPPPFREQ